MVDENSVSYALAEIVPYRDGTIQSLIMATHFMSKLRDVKPEFLPNDDYVIEPGTVENCPNGLTNNEILNYIHLCEMIEQMGIMESI